MTAENGGPPRGAAEDRDPLLDLYARATEPPARPAHRSPRARPTRRGGETPPGSAGDHPPALAEPQVKSPASAKEAAGGPDRGRRWIADRRWVVAAGLLLAAGGTGFLIWPRPVTDGTEAVAAPHEFQPAGAPAGQSGPAAPENRAVAVSAPPLPAAAFGDAAGGRLVAVEFAAGRPPAVWPRDDVRCPEVLPGRPTALAREPFIRPAAGPKWVVLLVTDRPAAAALDRAVAAGAGLDGESGIPASAAAVVAAARAAGCRVFACGVYRLEPMSP